MKYLRYNGKLYRLFDIDSDEKAFAEILAEMCGRPLTKEEIERVRKKAGEAKTAEAMRFWIKSHRRQLESLGVPLDLPLGR